MSNIQKDKIYRLKEAAELLCISRSTLRVWDREGYFIAGRTRGRHRIYIGEQLIEIQQKMFKKK
jgi:DNA-binding transcriptional MerR regulator